jgi:L-alanine-DL-glutamate epimerase-like enolase superfamily enzyme
VTANTDRNPGVDPVETDLRDFSLRLSKPLSTATGTIRCREGFLVRVVAGPVTGVGEATPLGGFTEPSGACRAALSTALDRLEDVGRPPDPADPSAETDHPALAAVEGRPAARHGFVLALLDLHARRRDVSVAEHLVGGDGTIAGSEDETPDAARSVPVNATIGDGSPSTTARDARDAIENGFPTVKVKVGARPVAADLDRLAAVREAVGPDVGIRADANGAWDRREASEALDGLVGRGITLDYVEQPLDADDLMGHAMLRVETPDSVRVAVDESLSRHTVGEVLAEDAADTIVLKPMCLGGVDRTVMAARAARGTGVETVVTTTVDAVVARVGAVHAAAALGSVPPCGLATANRLAEDLAGDPAPVVDGRIRVPAGPGHGVGGVVRD